MFQSAVIEWSIITTKLWGEIVNPQHATHNYSANSFDPDETQSNLASHQDTSCLTLRQHFHHFEQHRSTLKIETDKAFSRQQFYWQDKG